MNVILERYLFEKHILVSNGKEAENSFEVMFALANFFGIRVTKGAELLNRSMLITAGDCIGRDIPQPFYRGFPESVRALCPEQLLFDQLLHYFVTYGLGDFENPGHSVFETDFARTAFREGTVPKDFICVTESEAEELLRGYIDDLLSSSRPLSRSAFEVLRTYVTTYGYEPEVCASKDTAVKLLVEGRVEKMAKFLALSDVIRVVEHLNFTAYNNRNVKKLNLKNADRKFICSLIDTIFESGFVNIKACFEKKAVWCGLLHHIHYQPKCKEAEEFCHLMRNKGNQSVYSEFERHMEARDVKRAVDVLKAGKGSGAVLRSLDYLVSRCRTEEDVDYVVDALGRSRPILLLQLLFHYGNYSAGGARTFHFVKNGLTRHHTETDAEMKRRRTVLSAPDCARVAERMRELLTESITTRLGKVYIDPRMYKVALPIHEASASGGYGCLPSGSRIPIEKGTKIRAFTYWERVNDVDLSLIAVLENGGQIEYSWRTMYYSQCEEITFSGDETSGYDGGSEYFDVTLDKLKRSKYGYRYLVLCNNVYSGVNFSDVFCRAGYMVRENLDTGEVFEPKTVHSAFTIDCESTTAYLFAIDLKTNELVWLNLGEDSRRRVAGTSPIAFVLDRIGELEILSAGDLVALLADELVATPDEADLAFTDEPLEEKAGREQLHSYDYERFLSILG